MKAYIIAASVVVLTGCLTSQDRWNAFAVRNDCVPTGEQRELLAGSVYTIPQRRVVHKFVCQGHIVWSDLGNYARYNEWLEL